MATKINPEALRSGFDAPAYGEVVPVGTKFKDAEGNTRIVTNNGTKIIKKKA